MKSWFAVESGSRAWGFESTDSDYDVRFIYLSARKKAAEEIDEGKAVPIINRFIESELARLPAVSTAMPEGQGDVRDLDAFFHEVGRRGKL